MQVERQKRRTSEGVRRLSLALGIVGIIVGCLYAKPRFQALEHRRWDFTYFEKQRKSHPRAEVATQAQGLVLLEVAPPALPGIRSILDPLNAPKVVKADAWDNYQAATTEEDFRSRFDKLPLPKETKRALRDAKFGTPTSPPAGFGFDVYRERFPDGADTLPGVLEYLALLIPLAFGFLVPWGATRAVAWVLDGFRIDRSGA